MKPERGLTIVQTMLVLLILGIVGWFAVDFLIGKRCESDPSRPICSERQAPLK